MPIRSDTRPVFRNSDLLDQPKTLGEGALNKVYAVKEKDGEPFVFKPLIHPEDTDEVGWVAHQIGIPRTDPQVGMRNKAVHDFEKEFFDKTMTPEVRFAVLDVGDGKGEQLGMVMPLLDGQPAEYINPIFLIQPEVIKKGIDAQWRDAVFGEGDRHWQNILIDKKVGQSVRYQMIDGDQCWGVNKDPNELKHASDLAHFGFHGAGLPPVAGRTVAAEINAIRPSQARAVLKHNLMKSVVVNAAIKRIQCCKEELAELQEKGLIVSSSRWNDASVLENLTANNNYPVRDCVKAIQYQGMVEAIRLAPNFPARHGLGF